VGVEPAGRGLMGAVGVWGTRVLFLNVGRSPLHRFSFFE